MKGMKMGGKLKTTGNARTPVSGKPASVKVPGLPGMSGLDESKGVKARMTGKVGKGGSANKGSKY